MGRDDNRIDARNSDIHFNPRARVGRDHISALLTIFLQDFNPRARVGLDARAQSHGHGHDYFNPRALTGRD